MGQYRKLLARNDFGFTRDAERSLDCSEFELSMIARRKIGTCALRARTKPTALPSPSTRYREFVQL
jgi:hypothetical protein